MKRTKLLALALAGVMVLALLTGCSGGKTEDRRIAENIADSMMKQNHYNVKEVSYSVPELSGAVRSAFAPDWLNKAGTALDRDALAQDGRTVEVFLEDSLKAYKESTVYFFAFDATGESAYAQSERVAQGKAPSLPVFPYRSVAPSSYTKLRVGVCHKTVGERDYCLAVLVLA